MNYHQAPNSTLQSTSVSKRRHDLDWLRVIAFGILVFFHAAVLFTPNSIPRILNDPHSPELSFAVAFLHQFRLGLLFLVSGCGVYFALRKRDQIAYLKERSKRLLVPLLFGIAVLVPPMVYMEKLHLGSFTDDYVSFYKSLLTAGTYPNGNLSWHHFWFIAYLFLFCLITLPLFSHWKTQTGKDELADHTSWLTKGFRLYVVIGILVINELVLRPLFPGFRNLISDWASFVHWLMLFAFGYMVASSPKLLSRICELRHHSLVLGVLGSSILFAQFYNFEASRFEIDHKISLSNAITFIWFAAIRMVSVWAWLMTCVGFAARYLNKGSKVLAYLNHAVYPLFCLHLPATVAIAYVIIPSDLTITTKYLVIVTGTFAISFAIYHLIARKMPAIGILIGATAHATEPTLSRTSHSV